MLPRATQDNNPHLWIGAIAFKGVAESVVVVRCVGRRGVAAGMRGRFGRGQYGFTFDEDVNEDDTTLEKKWRRVVGRPNEFSVLSGR